MGRREAGQRGHSQPPTPPFPPHWCRPPPRPGVADDEAAENSADASTRTGHPHGGSASTDELGGGVNVPVGCARLDGPVGARPCLGGQEGGQEGGKLSPAPPQGPQFPPIELPAASWGAPERTGGTVASLCPSQGWCSAHPSTPCRLPPPVSRSPRWACYLLCLGLRSAQDGGREGLAQHP